MLCEGPSLLGARQSDLLPGPVIAINHALAVSYRLPVDFWASVDSPKNLWEWAQPHLHPETKLFSTVNNVLIWHEVLQDSIVPRLYAPDDERLRELFGDDGSDTTLAEVMGDRLYAMDPTYMDDWPDVNGRPALLPSVVFVLAWLASFPEIEEVRLIGCDMRGTNSPLSVEPYSEEEEDIGWVRRWQVERTFISLVTKEYRRRGKRIKRWDKTPRKSEALSSSF